MAEIVGINLGQEAEDIEVRRVCSRRPENDRRLQQRRAGSSLYSKIRMAEAITVVHLPRLSPTAVCVQLVVRTILLEMR
jgi:hypothetical protein